MWAGEHIDVNRVETYVLPNTAEPDLQNDTRGRHGGCVRRLQAGVFYLVRFERIVLRPRLAIATYGVIFETLGATVRINLGTTGVAIFLGLQDVDSRMAGPVG